MYQLCLQNPGYPDFVKRLSDSAFIPCVEGNADYQGYLDWLAEGNTPEPATPESN